MFRSLTKEGDDVAIDATDTSSLLAYAFKVSYDKYRGRMVHLRAFAGGVSDLKQQFLNTTNGKRESPTRLLRALADRFVDIDTVASKKRVFGAIAHINSGMTTTSKAMLNSTGALRRMGAVDVGDNLMDYLPERERGIIISAAAVSFAWQDHTFFLVDFPGLLDFTCEVERALKVMDGVIVLLDALARVQPQTEIVWRQADRYMLPRVVFVKKLDRDGADLRRVIERCSEDFRSRARGHADASR